MGRELELEALQEADERLAGALHDLDEAARTPRGRARQCMLQHAAGEASEVAVILARYAGGPASASCARESLAWRAAVDAGAGDTLASAINAVGRSLATIDAVRFELQHSGLMGDFASDMAADPTGFGGAWNQINAQLQSEGASSTQVLAAQNALASAFDNLSSQMPDAGQALAAAQQYVMAGQTAYGALTMVQNLQAAAAAGVPPAQLLQTFTGTMIGAGIAAGVITAGTGAAIVGGVSILVSVLQAAGLFGGPPSGTQVCPGVYCNNPSYVLPNGCTCVWDTLPSIVPGSASWRHFPNPNDPNDAGWFQPRASLPWGPFNWKGATWGAPLSDQWHQGWRLVDYAFGVYHHLECEMAANAGGTSAWPLFSQSFIAAWKLNAEYALNGLRPQPDWAVLVHAARVWNRAHDASSVLGLSSQSGVVAQPGTSCPSSMLTPYESIIAADAIANLPASDPLVSNGQIVINAGPQLQVSQAPGTGGGGGSSSSSSASSSSAAPAILLGTAALGAGGWYLLGKPTSWPALKAAFATLFGA